MFFDFCFEFFFVGKIELVFAGKKLFILVEDGVAGNVFVCLCAQNNSQCRVISLVTFKVVIPCACLGILDT